MKLKSPPRIAARGLSYSSQTPNLVYTTLTLTTN